MASFKEQQDELFGGGSSSSSSTKKKAKTPKPAARSVSASSKKVSMSSQPTVQPRREPTERDRENLRQAQAMIQDAQKYLKRPSFTLFWSADPYKAAKEYEKAGNKMFAAGFLTEAREAFSKAADIFTSDHQYNYAVKLREKAAELAIKEKVDTRTLVEFHRQTAIAYFDLPDNKRAASALLKAAKLLVRESKTEAAATTMEACDALCSMNQDPQSVHLGPTGHEVYRDAINLLVDSDSIDAALSLFGRYCIFLERNEMDGELHKAFLTQVILELHRGDRVKADDHFRGHLNNDAYLRTMECKVEEHLLTAIKRGDAKALATAQDASVIRFLHPSVSRIAQQLKVDDDTLPEPDDDDEDDDNEEEDEEAGGDLEPHSESNLHTINVPSFSEPNEGGQRAAEAEATPQPVQKDEEPVESEEDEDVADLDAPVQAATERESSDVAPATDQASTVQAQGRSPTVEEGGDGDGDHESNLAEGAVSEDEPEDDEEEEEDLS